MSITTTQAAEIAKRHGLTLQDAAGLVSLADSTDEAEAIAGKFAGTESGLRSAIKGIFDEAKTPPGLGRFTINVPADFGNKDDAA